MKNKRMGSESINVFMMMEVIVLKEKEFRIKE